MKRRAGVQPVVPAIGQESVWDYPRPPRIERSSKHIRVVLDGTVVAETRRAIRVLETSHPPVYYIPRGDTKLECLKPASGQTQCEWKGGAVYFDVIVAETVRPRAAWSYPNPTGDAELLRDCIAFYCSAMSECWVDNQRATPQPGSFYGGWITSDVVGPFKGSPGTEGW